MYLGVTRQFCDLTNTILLRRSVLPVSRLISIANTIFSCLPASALLCHHRLFLLNSNESQSDIYTKIRQHPVPFLWFFLMGLIYGAPVDDDLVQLALSLDAVNNCLCTPSLQAEEDIQKWHNYLFSFRVSFTTLFAVDVTTKLHRLIRHVEYHPVFLGCLRQPRKSIWYSHRLCRGSSEKTRWLTNNLKESITVRTNTLNISNRNYYRIGTIPVIMLLMHSLKTMTLLRTSRFCRTTPLRMQTYLRQ